MNAQHTFVAERAAAQHCAQLLRRCAEPSDQLGALAALGQQIAAPFAAALAQLLGGAAPSVMPQPPRELGEADLVAQIGAFAANRLYASGVPGVTLLGSLDGATVLRLVDRAFGGKGELSGALPDVFPLSAQMLVQRIEVLLARCLTTAIGHGEVEPLRRATRLAELAPFPAGAKLAVLAVEVADGAQPPWTLTLCMPLLMLPKLFANPLVGATSAARRGSNRSDPATAPFAALPLGLTATLVDMPISLAAIAALVPGTVLPVGVARAVPIAIGGITIARGSIGAQDDRIALRLTKIGA